MAATVCELQWVTYILRDMGIHVLESIPLCCDSKAAMHIGANPVFYERIKHLDIDCRVVRDQYKSRFISLRHVSSSDQLADCLTKGLRAPTFQKNVSKLGLLDFFQASAWGGNKIYV